MQPICPAYSSSVPIALDSAGVVQSGMLSQEELESFDFLQWLGTGALAARQLCCNQATVSRHAVHVQKTLGISLQRLPSGTYGVTGNDRLLKLERQVHQVARLLGRRSMRLHLITGKGHLSMGLPHGWCSNPPCPLEAQVDGAALLDGYVLDACIMQRPQVASLDSERYCVVELLNSPLFLVANGAHALTQEKGITATDLASQTQLIHLDILPVATRLATEQLHASLLGDPAQVVAQPEALARLVDCGPRADVVYVSALGLGKENRVGIDFSVNCTTSDYLVFLKENMEAPGMQLLMDELRSSLRAAALRLPELACAL